MITDGKMDPRAFVTRAPIRSRITTAVSLTNAVVDRLQPGYRFEVVGVEVYSRTVTAAITVDVRINATSVLTAQVTPVAGSVVQGTLVPTRSGRRSNLVTDTLDITLTTNASGAAVDLNVTVWIRAYPCNGEA